MSQGSGTSCAMATRYILQPDSDGSYAILDVFTGLRARYLGRELSRIPADMASDGLRILNELDQVRREAEEKPVLDFRRIS